LKEASALRRDGSDEISPDFLRSRLHVAGYIRGPRLKPLG
jgi:hypothetical protein